MNYIIPDTSADLLMDVAKILANSPDPMSLQDVNRSFPKPKTEGYVNAALTMCEQLGLCKSKYGAYVSAEKYRDDIKLSTRDQHFVILRRCLNQYSPFLLYINFGSKGYTSLQAAAAATGILKIKGSLDVIEYTLRRLGGYSQLTEYNKSTGNIKVKEPPGRLSAEYVAKLMKALEAELKTKVFIIDLLSAEVFAYFDRKGITVDNLTDALVDFENDPRTAAGKSTRTLELFLYRLGEDVGAKVQKANGVSQLADRIKEVDAILPKHQHLVYGLGAVRNMSDHDPEKQTGKEWEITKHGGLLTTLLVPAVIRSVYLYHTAKRQEF